MRSAFGRKSIYTVSQLNTTRDSVGLHLLHGHFEINDKRRSSTHVVHARVERSAMLALIKDTSSRVILKEYKLVGMAEVRKFFILFVKARHVILMSGLYCISDLAHVFAKESQSYAQQQKHSLSTSTSLRLNLSVHVDGNILAVVGYTSNAPAPNR